MNRPQFIVSCIFILFSLFFLFSHLQGSSVAPWFNKRLVIPAANACSSFPFDGGARPFSPMRLLVVAEEPVWLVIYSGTRYIRENIRSSRRMVFNFVNADGFFIQICRNNFADYDSKNTNSAGSQSSFSVFVSSN